MNNAPWSVEEAMHKASKAQRDAIEQMLWAVAASGVTKPGECYIAYHQQEMSKEGLSQKIEVRRRGDDKVLSGIIFKLVYKVEDKAGADKELCPRCKDEERYCVPDQYCRYRSAGLLCLMPNAGVPCAEQVKCPVCHGNSAKAEKAPATFTSAPMAAGDWVVYAKTASPGKAQRVYRVELQSGIWAWKTITSPWRYCHDYKVVAHDVAECIGCLNEFNNQLRVAEEQHAKDQEQLDGYKAALKSYAVVSEYVQGLGVGLVGQFVWDILIEDHKRIRNQLRKGVGIIQSIGNPALGVDWLRDRNDFMADNKDI